MARPESPDGNPGRAAGGSYGDTETQGHTTVYSAILHHPV